MAASAKSKKASSKSKAQARPAKAPVSAGLPRPFSEFLGIALFAVGALIFGGLVSYQGGDGDLMGPVGHLAAAALYASFGMAAYLVAVGVIGMGIKALRGEGMEIGLSEGAGFAIATLAGCVLLHVMFPTYRVHGYTAGGLAGELVGEVMLGMFHHAGTYLVAATVMCLGLLASTPLSTAHLAGVAKVVGQSLQRAGDYLWGGAIDLVRSQREPDDEEQLDEELDDARRREDEALARRFDAIDDDALEDDELEDDEEYEYEDEEEEEEQEEEEEAEEEEASASGGRKKNKRNRKVTGQRANQSAAKGKAKATKGKSTKGKAKPKSNRKRAAEEDVDNVVGQELEVDLPVGKSKSSKAKSTKGSKAKPADAEVEEAPEEVPEIVLKAEEDAEPKPKPPGKKAPPRPEQLAKPSAAPAPAKDESKQGIPGLIKLTGGAWELPPLQLFEAAEEKVETEIDRGFVLEQAQRLVSALGEFKIKGKVTKIHPGPVITRYEFKPEPGTKLSRIESLENDLAMALEAIRIRILAPIPGKATVGFEVPNKTRETVYIKEILGQENFGGKQRLPLALGKDITGTITVTDLAKAPHLLVAGATGSGKSVGVNSMICSLLYRCSPEDVRMIMIDPKMLELSIYEGIPHLLLPVVTDPEKAALALRWAVQEMERRYQLLSAAQVRDIAGYNKKLGDLVKSWEVETKQIELAAAEAARDAADEGEDGANGASLPGVSFDAHGNPSRTVGGTVELPDKPTKLPYVVVIIDEFADLMMVASKEVEQSVARIAAKARAAGIHLIVATQRPSVDVITGTIKNNFPSRIAFQVTSDADSRTILDRKGAKQLLGMGDMLHMDRGSEVARVHGCFVSEDEILEVVKFVKKQAKPVYNMDIVRKTDDGDGDGPSMENMDPLYDKGVQIVAEAQKVSTSMLQRRLGIGYNRAAKIVEAMEEQGVIGPSRGTTPREVYVSPA